MSKAVEALYSPGTVNYKRLFTDALFWDDGADCAFEGIIGKSIDFIEGFQLLEPAHWKRFTDQFRLHTDSENSGWRGEYWGKMMRGAVLTYSCTRNDGLYSVLHETVCDMLETQDELGRISSFDVEHEFHGWDVWCRKYVLLGMQYFLEINRDSELGKRVIESMKRQVDYIMSKLGPAEEGKLPITKASNCWQGLNSSSLLEPVVRLYDLTGEKKYLDYAGYIVANGGTNIANVFTLAYEDITDPYQYPIVKAYELMSCFEGLLEYYRATGETKWRDAVVRFSRRLMNTDITVIGSAGCTHELLDHSAARQTDPTYEGVMQETCVTVTWMKFCCQLLALTGDPVYADRFEQALYNAYLGAVNTEKIVNSKAALERDPSAIPEALPFDSYSALLPGVRGRGVGGLQIMPDKHYYGCCACIGAAGIGLVSKACAMLKDNGIAVNLYIPGSFVTKTPDKNSLSIHTKTNYPADGSIVMTLGLEEAEAFAIDLRIPEWSAVTVLRINGEAVDVTPGYTSITRCWNDGDVIELSLDMRTRIIKPIPNPKDILMTQIHWSIGCAVPRVVVESPYAKFHIAMRRGPLVLARDARLGGEVDEAVEIMHDAEGIVSVTPTDVAGFDKLVEFDIPLVGGGSFKAVDYSSAGKTWSEESKYGCWMPTRDYRK